MRPENADKATIYTRFFNLPALMHNKREAVHMPDNFDLTIVGAGPAGSLLATLALEAGLATLLIDKSSMPRPKVCGGFLSARSLALLPRELIPSCQGGNAPQKIRLITTKKSYEHTPAEQLGLLFDRISFDHYLFSRAQQKGAAVREGHCLRSLVLPGKKEKDVLLYLDSNEKTSSTIKTRYVVGADGARGTLAIMAGMRKKQRSLMGWGLAESKLVSGGEGKPSSLDFYPLTLHGGMAWSFQAGGLLNRGVGGLRGRHALLKAYNQVFPQETKRLPAWPLPFLGPLQKNHKGNILLIGDAAGLVDPFSGEGLYNCFRSAHLALEAILQAKRKGLAAGPLYGAGFEQHFRKGFTPSLLLAVIMHARSIVSPHQVPRLIAALMLGRRSFTPESGS